MRTALRIPFAVVTISCLVFIGVCANERYHQTSLPTTKILSLPAPSFVARMNCYPTTIAISPDPDYATVLNQGYGTEQSGVRQSIAVLDAILVTVGCEVARRQPNKATLSGLRSRRIANLYASLASASQRRFRVVQMARPESLIITLALRTC